MSAATCGMLLVAAVSQAAEIQTPRLQVEQTEEAIFPPSLLAQGITNGEAWLVISIGADGKLTDALVSRYTERAFANEAMRAIRQWQFEPVRVHGRPVDVCLEVRFSFAATGCIVSLDPFTTMQKFTAIANQPNYQKHICQADELDRLPVPTRKVSPLHPGLTPNAKVTGGKVVLEFIVDETGHVRMPVLVSANDVEFGNRATEALTQWEFTTPTRRGKPVAVWVRQEFVFPTDS